MYYTGAQTEHPLAAIVREKTDGGSLIVQFLINTMQGKLENSKPCHQLDAARQLINIGFKDAKTFIQNHTRPARTRTAAASRANGDSRFATELAEIVREETDGGRTTVQFLVDVMQGELKGFKPSHRIAASKELLRRGFDEQPRQLQDDGLSYEDDDLPYEDDDLPYEDDDLPYEDDDLSHEDDDLSYEDDEDDEDDDLSYEGDEDDDEYYTDREGPFDFETPMAPGEDFVRWNAAFRITTELLEGSDEAHSKASKESFFYEAAKKKALELGIEPPHVPGPLIDPDGNVIDEESYEFKALAFRYDLKIDDARAAYNAGMNHLHPELERYFTPTGETWWDYFCRLYEGNTQPPEKTPPQPPQKHKRKPRTLIWV